MIVELLWQQGALSDLPGEHLCFLTGAVQTLQDQHAYGKSLLLTGI